MSSAGFLGRFVSFLLPLPRNLTNGKKIFQKKAGCEPNAFRTRSERVRYAEKNRTRSERGYSFYNVTFTIYIIAKRLIKHFYYYCLENLCLNIKMLHAVRFDKNDKPFIRLLPVSSPSSRPTLEMFFVCYFFIHLV